MKGDVRESWDDHWARLSGRPFTFFPDEVNRLSSRAQAWEMLAEAGLSAVPIDVPARAGFVHLVVVARRAAA